MARRLQRVTLADCLVERHQAAAERLIAAPLGLVGAETARTVSGRVEEASGEAPTEELTR